MTTTSTSRLTLEDLQRAIDSVDANRANLLIEIRVRSQAGFLRMLPVNDCIFAPPSLTGPTWHGVPIGYDPQVPDDAFDLVFADGHDERYTVPVPRTVA